MSGDAAYCSVDSWAGVQVGPSQRVYIIFEEEHNWKDRGAKVPTPIRMYVMTDPVFSL